MLKLLRSQGMPSKQLCMVFFALVLSRITNALSACGGHLTVQQMPFSGGQKSSDSAETVIVSKPYSTLWIVDFSTLCKILIIVFIIFSPIAIPIILSNLDPGDIICLCPSASMTCIKSHLFVVVFLIFLVHYIISFCASFCIVVVLV